jgi:hypothetical protein
VFKNKLFFFSSYEGYRNREGVLFRRTVPTAAMKAGDFSDYRNLTTGAVVPIYDPWTQCGINNPGTGVYNGDCGTVPNRQQFPGNIIPANRISSIAQKYLNFPVFADPTVPGRWKTENWEHNASVGGDNDQLSFRGDYNVSQKQRVLGRYTRFESTNLPVDLYGNGQRQGDPYSPEHFITTQVMAADTYTASTSCRRSGCRRRRTARFQSVVEFQGWKPSRRSPPVRTASSAPVSFTPTTNRTR